MKKYEKVIHMVEGKLSFLRENGWMYLIKANCHTLAVLYLKSYLKKNKIAVKDRLSKENGEKG